MFTNRLPLTSGQVVRDNITRLQAIATKLQTIFTKVGQENQFKVKMFRLKVAAINLVNIVCGSNKSALTQTESFVSEFEEITKSMSEAKVDAEPFLLGVLTALSIPEAKPGYVARKLKPLLSQHPPSGLSFVSLDTSMARATIHEPSAGQETPLKFMAGLVLGVPMDCEVHGVMDPSLLRVCVRTGDQEVHLTLPRTGDLTPRPGGSGFRLLTTALLSHQVWTETLDVEITVGLELDGGELLHLSNPVRVPVLPKAVRRGI